MSEHTYISVPTEVEAIQFTGYNWEEMKYFVQLRMNESLGIEVPGFNVIGTYCMDYLTPWAEAELWVEANKTSVPISRGEWIIHDEKGFYPCKDDVFQKKYRPIGGLRQAGTEKYDEGTMMKVGEVLRAHVGPTAAIHVVNDLQNAGILFRERA